VGARTVNSTLGTLNSKLGTGNDFLIRAIRVNLWRFSGVGFGRYRTVPSYLTEYRYRFFVGAFRFVVAGLVFISLAMMFQL